MVELFWVSLSQDPLLSFSLVHNFAMASCIGSWGTLSITFFLYHFALLVPHEATKAAGKSVSRRWQDQFRHEMAMAEASSKMPVHRISSQAAWAKVAEDQSTQLGGQLAAPSKLNTADTILVQLSGTWVPALILSVWRLYRNGNSTSQLTAVEIPRGCVHSARAVIFKVGDDGTATCEASSNCQVFSLKHLGVSAEISEVMESLDGYRCKLSASTAKAIKQLNQDQDNDQKEQGMDAQKGDCVDATDGASSKKAKACKGPVLKHFLKKPGKQDKPILG